MRDLVILQRDQRRDDDRRPFQEQPRELVDRGLAAAGRQDGQHVASRDRRRHGSQLTRAQAAEPESSARKLANRTLVSGRVRHEDSGPRCAHGSYRRSSAPTRSSRATVADLAHANPLPKLTLGDTDVTRIGLGTNRLAHTPENVAFVAEAVAAGVSLIDTAHTYTGGESEETIGDALSPVPEESWWRRKAGSDQAKAARRCSLRRSKRAFGVYAPKPSRSTTCTGSIPRPRSRRASP